MSLIIATVQAIGVFVFFCMYFAYKLEEQHFLLKLLLIFIAVSTLNLLPNALVVEGDDIGSALNFIGLLRATTWLMRLFLTYYIVYFIYDWFRRTEFAIRHNWGYKDV